MAINELVDYEWKHRVNMDVAGRMKGAKAEGKPKRLNLEKLLVRDGSSKDLYSVTILTHILTLIPSRPWSRR